jgi:hypothetical protein
MLEQILGAKKGQGPLGHGGGNPVIGQGKLMPGTTTKELERALCL